MILIGFSLLKTNFYCTFLLAKIWNQPVMFYNFLSISPNLFLNVSVLSTNFYANALCDFLNLFHVGLFIPTVCGCVNNLVFVYFITSHWLKLKFFLQFKYSKSYIHIKIKHGQFTRIYCASNG